MMEWNCATASWARMKPTRRAATSAWIRRSGARCSARDWRRKSRWRCLAPAPPSPSSRWTTLPDDPDVLELPRIALVDVLGKEAFAIGERGPVGVGADHVAPVGLADLDVAPEIDLVRLDQAAIGILHGPYHAREARRGDLQAGGIVEGRQGPRLLDGQLRAVPVGILLVPGQEHAQLVAAAHHILTHDPFLLLDHEIATGELVHRGDGGITGVIRVMRGGPIDDVGTLAHGQVVGDRDRLGVGDAKAVEVAGERRPGAHARGGAGLRQIDRGAVAAIMAFAITGEIALMGAPAQLGRLRTLADDTVHQPDIHELTQASS